MSDPFDPNGTSGAQVGTVGAPTGFLDNFHSTLQVATQNDNYLAGEGEIRQAWDNSVRALQEKQGSTFARSDPLPMVEDILDPGKERTLTRAFLGVNDTSPNRVAAFEEAQKINEQLKALNDPNLPSLEAIIEQVKQARLQRSADASEVTAASDGVPGFLGRLAGGLTAALSDPAQLPTLMAGGFGKTAAVRIASEVAANAAAGGVIQGELINPQNKAFGEQQGSVVDAALIGGALGGVVGGAREGLGALASRALDRALPKDLAPLDMSDPQLRQMFPADSPNPSIRAGSLALDEQAHFDASNPYADTSAGLKRFTGEAEDIFSSLTGTQRVIAQVLPEPADFTFDNLDYHTQVVREQAPEVFNRLEQATGRVNQLDEQITAAQQRLDGLTVGDALTQLDPATGDLVKGYEAELANPNISEADRAALEQRIQGIVESVQAVPQETRQLITDAEARLNDPNNPQPKIEIAQELDQLYKSVGENNLQKAHDSVAVPAKKELQSLRASRKAAAKEFRAARQEMDRRIEAVKREELAKELLHPQQGTGPRTLFDVEALRPDRVADSVRATEAATKALEDGNYHEDLVRTVEEPAPAADGTPPEPTTMVPDGHVDVGGGLVLPKDFAISDPRTMGGRTTVGELFAAMQEDQKLVEAMRICSL